MRLSQLLAVALPLFAPVAAQAQTTPAGKEALDILTESVAVPTVAGRGQVPVLAEKLKARLVAAGFAASDVVFTPIGETGYLTARYPGRDRAAKPIAVIGHMDVVEAKAADWKRDPFVPVVENGYVYGRGSLDNKADVSMIVATLLKLRREGWVPGRDIVLALSGDEETTMVTTKAMAEALRGAELVLNGDAGGGELDEAGKPIVYGLQAGEKVYGDFVLKLTDPGGHSSRPGKSNAIVDMASALAKVGAYRFAPQVSPLTKAYWEATAPGAPADLAAAMRALAADPADAKAAELLSSKPEYVGIVRTTCVPTTISGGHAPNALPQSVTANVNCRIFPGTPRAAIKATLTEIIANPAITIEVKDGGAVEAPESPLRPDVTAAVKRAVQQRSPGVPIAPNMSAGATDSSHFRALGVPSYGISTTFMRSVDDFAHGLDERLPVATLDPGVKQYETLLRTLAK